MHTENAVPLIKCLLATVSRALCTDWNEAERDVDDDNFGAVQFNTR